MLDLRNTSSLVTGGASGLGEAAARLLADRGAKVVVADLNDDRGKQVAGELGGDYVHADVTSTDAACRFDVWLVAHRQYSAADNTGRAGREQDPQYQCRTPQARPKNSHEADQQHQGWE